MVLHRGRVTNQGLCRLRFCMACWACCGGVMAIINKDQILEAIEPLKRSAQFSHIQFARGYDFEMMIAFDIGIPTRKTLRFVISHHPGDTSAFVSPFVNGRMKETFLAFTGKKLYEYCLRWLEKIE